MNQLFSSILKMSSGLLFMGAVIGCAHGIDAVKIPNTASPTAEIANQRVLLDEAYTNQVDVFAPDNFKKSEDALTKAKKDNDNGKTPEKVLESVGYSKAYLNKANVDANVVRPNLPEVAEARELALKAGARNSHSKELYSLDNKLRNLTDSPEDSGKIDAEEKAKLQAKYLDLELVAIKAGKLSEAKATLDQAKKKGAEKMTPKAYDEALQQYNVAEKLIETDRHSLGPINAAASQANSGAKRVLALIETAQATKNQTPEQRAMALEARDLALKQSEADAAKLAAQTAQQGMALSAQGASMAAVQGENRDLKKKEQEDAMVNTAAAQFKKSEAEVYRQEGNLVIRLKSMNFASGRSDLPSESLAVLAKVKDVIKKLEPDSVKVEGHTDGLGAAVANQQLSEKRAKSVATYFSSDKVLEESKIESVGYGYSKPLSTNKTKEGRAQNRRVDIVITPGHSVE